MLKNHFRFLAVSAVFAACAGSGFAEDRVAVQDTSNTAEQEPSDSKKTGTKKQGIFELGQINVVSSGTRWGYTSGQSLSQSTVTSEDVRVYNRNTLDDALKIVPGVSVHNTGGTRNEKKYYIRGFDMNQAPLMIDGVMVYLPYDNALDAGRFMTPDLAEIQVQKGYVSVLNGPGGMGGAVNMVTRKPTKEFEFEFRPTIELGNKGSRANYTTYGYIGTKQDAFYMQASGVYRNDDGFFLSRHYNPDSTGNSAIQGSGRREYAEQRDQRINLKLGFTPNETDEYAFNYTRQEGRKDSPYSVLDPIKQQRNWRWPRWDVETVSFQSHTQIGDASYVKSRLFYARFDNTLESYDDYHFNSQTTKKAFNTDYYDTSWGGNLEFGTELIPMNTLKGAVYFRRDEHTKDNINQPSLTSAKRDPKVSQEEDVISVALENTFHATDRLDFVGGVSYDYRDLSKAEYYNKTSVAEYDLTSDHAWNWQMAVIYRLSDTGEVHASVSNRTRFPTLKERFSSHFGSSVSNPNLGAEEATNYEIGWSDMVTPDLSLGAAVFYNDIRDMIDSIYLDQWDSKGNQLAQNQNVGDAKYYGVELKAEWQALDNFAIGGHYTYLYGKIESPDNPGLRVTSKPRHQAFLYVNWLPIEQLKITPSLEYASSRYSESRVSNKYYKSDGFVLGNITAEYTLKNGTSLLAGIRNITDENYELEAGFPEAGRTFFMSGSIKF